MWSFVTRNATLPLPSKLPQWWWISAQCAQHERWFCTHRSSNRNSSKRNHADRPAHPGVPLPSPLPTPPDQGSPSPVEEGQRHACSTCSRTRWNHLASATWGRTPGIAENSCSGVVNSDARRPVRASKNPPFDVVHFSLGVHGWPNENFLRLHLHVCMHAHVHACPCPCMHAVEGARQGHGQAGSRGCNHTQSPHGARSRPSVRTQPPPATGAPSQTSCMALGRAIGEDPAAPATGTFTDLHHAMPCMHATPSACFRTCDLLATQLIVKRRCLSPHALFPSLPPLRSDDDFERETWFDEDFVATVNKPKQHK